MSLTDLAESMARDGWDVDLCIYNGSELVTAARGIRLVSIMSHRGQWLVIHGAGRFVVPQGDADGIAKGLKH